jgi:hypothetical protein
LRRKGKAKGARGSNTCFREIATQRLTPQETSITLGASGAGFPQCGDPFAGDCDTTRMKAHCSSVSSWNRILAASRPVFGGLRPVMQGHDEGPVLVGRAGKG